MKEDIDDSDPGLIGRDVELDHLKESYETVCSSQGRTVILSGEIGIGKTTLVDEFFRGLSETSSNEDLITIRSECLSDELEPFMPVKKALVEADLGHLISEKPPPKVLCTY
ncbi:MAG: AAA family ATPase, partial [Thermoplasmatota archaeon]